MLEVSTSMALSVLYILLSPLRASAFDMPLHIQQDNIWPYLHWTQRAIIGELSVHCYVHYQSAYPILCAKIRKYFQLSEFISQTNTSSRSLNLHRFINEFNGVPTNQDIHFIEKLTVQICLTFEHSLDICNDLVEFFQLVDPCHRERLDLILKMNEPQIRVLNVESLTQMFEFGLDEMSESGTKCNRFTRFALAYLDAVLKNCEFGALHQIWQNIVGAELLDDYLARPALCRYPCTAYRAIECMIDDGLMSDGLNAQRLSLMSRHRSLLFNFELIMITAINSRRWSDLQLVQLLNFMIGGQLMEWKDMVYLLDIMMLNCACDINTLAYLQRYSGCACTVQKQAARQRRRALRNGTTASAGDTPTPVALNRPCCAVM